MTAKQKNRRTGKSKKSSAVNEPLAEYLPDTGPVITVDATGRMVLPKKIRTGSNQTGSGSGKPKGISNSFRSNHSASLLGILPDLDIKAIYRDHDREVEEEDADDRSQYPC